jgi:hypothetical protein
MKDKGKRNSQETGNVDVYTDVYANGDEAMNTGEIDLTFLDEDNA